VRSKFSHRQYDQPDAILEGSFPLVTKMVLNRSYVKD
jgi:hypothetical protein